MSRYIWYYIQDPKYIVEQYMVANVNQLGHNCCSSSDYWCVVKWSTGYNSCFTKKCVPDCLS